MSESHDVTNASGIDAESDDLSLHLSTCTCAACMAADPFKDDVARNDVPTDTGTAAAGAVATLQEMADFLALGYWNNGTGLRHNVGTTGLDPNNGVLYYNVSGFGTLTYGGGSDTDGVSAARAELIRDAFDIYEAVLGIDFVETTSTNDSVVDFFFSDNKSGAYAGSTRYSDGTIYYSYINIADTWSGGTSTYDDYTLQTILHEIGHALGLGHQGGYNGSASYAADADFELDSWQASMMSYFSQTENTLITADGEFLQTPMAVDWIALDDIYSQFGFGVSNAFTGDTVYGFNTNISASESRIWNQFSTYADQTASTIIDAGGIDTLDFSGYSANQKIDLTVQSASQTYQDTSDIGGRTGNLTLAVGTVIENAIGGAGDDALIGNLADNALSGGGGDDTLTGQAGDDTLDGGAGFDIAAYNQTYASYSFNVLSSAIEVLGEGLDLVLDTVEQFSFADVSYSYSDIVSLFGGSGGSNVAPVANTDAAVVGEGAALAIDVLANDSDPDGDPLSVTAVNGQAIAVGGSVTLASGASVSLNADGTLSYAQNGAFDTLNTGESAADSFAYTVSDGAGGEDTAAVNVTINGSGSAGGGTGGGTALVGESGAVTVAQSGSGQWHSVSFTSAIENAVVVMGPLSFNDTDPATTRVRNVTDTGFEFQIDEWNYLDGVHLAETIGWLAVSEGTHTLENGQTIVAGTQSASTSFATVGFGQSLSEAIVLAEVTSVNEADAVTTRIDDVTSTGFDLRLQEEEALGAHVPETVSWIALETGVGAGLEVVLTGDQVRSSGASFQFGAQSSSAPVILADMQTFDGSDTATVRLTALDTSGLSMFIEEEESANTETNHTTEVVGYAGLSAGQIFVEAGPNTDPDAVDDAVTVAEDAPLVIDVLANDTDADGDALSVVSVAGQSIAPGGTVQLAAGTSVTLNGDGTLSYAQNGAFDGLSAGQTGSAGFSYTVSDGAGGTDQATVSITVEGADENVTSPIGQSGSVTVAQSGPDQWHSVTFDATIANAVVVMGPLTLGDDAPATTRVRNVTDTGFEFQIDEWDYLDGVHGTETIGWMALSEGTHTLSNGQTLVAGTEEVGINFETVDIGQALTDAVVIAEVTSVNEASAVGTRLRNVTSNSFDVQIEEEEAGGLHTPETVSWIAIESGSATGLDVVRTPDQVDDLADSFVFNTGFGTPPVLLADMQTTDGADTASTRVSSIDLTGVSLLVQEEASADTELVHTDEVMGYVAMTEGLIYLDTFLA